MGNYPVLANFTFTVRGGGDDCFYFLLGTCSLGVLLDNYSLFYLWAYCPGSLLSLLLSAFTIIIHCFLAQKGFKARACSAALT